MAGSGARVTGLRCMKCGREYAPGEAAYTCESCGLEGILDVLYDYDEIARGFTRTDLEESRENSHWRYLPLMPVASSESLPVLRAGWTPLYSGRGLLDLPNHFIKDDSLNPTASLKDRATSVGIARAMEENASAVAAASTGNAGSSLAGFAAAEHVPCYIFVPASAPRPKVAQRRHGLRRRRQLRRCVRPGRCGDRALRVVQSQLRGQPVPHRGQEDRGVRDL